MLYATLRTVYLKFGTRAMEHNFVRNLDILMFDLIQKITHNIVVAYMCTCVILSLLRLQINIARTNAITADILKVKNNCLRLYPEEGPVPKAPAAPFALVA